MKTPFTIVGLPGSDKTAVAHKLAPMFDLEVISASEVADRARVDITSPVMLQYIAKFRDTYGVPPNLETMIGTRSAFHAAHGAKAVEDFEARAVVAALQSGELDGKIIDLGDTVSFRREEIREALRDRGITSVFMAMSEKKATQRLLGDYWEARNCGASGGHEGTRKQPWFEAARAVEKEDGQVAKTLAAFIKEASVAMTPYYELAELKVKVLPSDSVIGMAAKVEIALKTPLSAQAPRVN